MTSNDIKKINKILASGNKEIIEKNKDIKKANEWLLCKDGIDEPEWVKEFFDANIHQMEITTARAQSKKGLATVDGYAEGYFNEIIQNANDLNTGNRVDIILEIENDIVKVECEYLDNGFTIQNIFSFLLRNMSDKEGNNTTGKFGIGIKSLLAFSNHLKITSNVNIDVVISNEIEDISARIGKNTNWNTKTTKLEFEYSLNSNLPHNFNLEKLTSLTKYLKKGKLDEKEIELFFYGSKDQKKVFDIYSLLFTKNIKKLEFSDINHNNRITLESNSSNDKNIYSRSESKIEISKEYLNIYQNEKLVYEDELLLIKMGKYAVGSSLKYDNQTTKYFSVYYLKQNNNDSYGLYINTPKSNLSRNDIGENQKEISKEDKIINENLNKIIEFMLSEDVSKSKYINEVSEVLHGLLIKFNNIEKRKEKNKKEENEEEDLFNLVIDNRMSNKYLPKINGEAKEFTINGSDVENLAKQKIGENKSEVLRVKSIYNKYIEKDEVLYIDDILSDTNNMKNVKRIYEMAKNEEVNEKVLDILGYFNSIEDFISYRILDRRDKPNLNDIDKWISKFYNDENILLKIIGRYNLVDCINWYGEISKEKINFLSYLFNSGKIDRESTAIKDALSEKFQEEYLSLKNDLSSGIGSYRRIEPIGRSRTYTWKKSEIYRYTNVNFNESKIFEKNIKKFIKILNRTLIANIKVFPINGKIVLFENNEDAKKSSNLKKENNFVHYDDTLVNLIDLSFLEKINLIKFDELIKNFENLKLLDKEVKEKISININLNITIRDISKKIFKWYIENIENFDAMKIDGIQINLNIEELSADESKENIEVDFKKFIKGLTGYDIHVYNSDYSNKNYIGYLQGDKIKLKKGTVSQKSNFELIGKRNSDDKDIYIFCSETSQSKINSIINLVLEDILGKDLDIETSIKGYITPHKIGKNINVRDYYEELEEKKIINFSKKSQKDIKWQGDLSNKSKKELLLARGSYDCHCPKCNQMKKAEKLVLSTIPNYNQDNLNKYKYIITILCKDCIENLKNSLVYASYFDEKDEIEFVEKLFTGNSQASDKVINIKITKINKLIIENQKKL